MAKKYKIWLGSLVLLGAIWGLFFITNPKSAMAVDSCSLNLTSPNHYTTGYSAVYVGEKATFSWSASTVSNENNYKTYWFGTKNGISDAEGIYTGFSGNRVWTTDTYTDAMKGQYSRYIEFRDSSDNVVCRTNTLLISVVSLSDVPVIKIYNTNDSSRNPVFWLNDRLHMTVSNLPVNQSISIEHCATYKGSSECVPSTPGTIVTDSNGVWSNDIQLLGISLGDWTRWIKFNGIESNKVSYSVVATPSPVENISCNLTWFGQTESNGAGIRKIGESSDVRFDIKGLPSNASFGIENKNLNDGTSFSVTSKADSYGNFFVGRDQTTIKDGEYHVGRYETNLLYEGRTISCTPGFVIVATPTPTPIPTDSAITVLFPNGGEVLKKGDKINITWRRNWMPDQANGLVSGIYYNMGGLNQLIVENVKDGSYEWTIPESIAEGGNYKIAITSAGYNGGISSVSLSDLSDGAFRIVSSLNENICPTFSFNKPNFYVGEKSIWKVSGGSSNLKVYVSGTKNGVEDANKIYVGVTPFRSEYIYKTKDIGDFTRYAVIEDSAGNFVCNTNTLNIKVEATKTEEKITNRLYELSEIKDGDIIRGEGDIAVWIVKIVGEKRFKRWLFGPQIFTAYGHLGFDKVKNVSKETLNHFDTSNLIRKHGDEKVHELTDFVPGTRAVRRWVQTVLIFSQRGFDFDSVYVVNEKEFKLYTEGDPLPLSQVENQKDNNLLGNISDAMFRFFGIVSR